MKNFEFHNPVKVIFGDDVVSQIGQQAALYGKKAMLVYGRSSLKTNGTFDRIVTSLAAEGLQVVEYSGVQANPLLSHTRDGIALAKKEKVDVVIAAGGGSVLDEAKAICIGSALDGDIWDFMNGQCEATSALPLLTIPTVAATGSEMNGGFVLTNDETRLKAGMIHPIGFPKVSLMEPALTASLSLKYTACAAVDIFSHMTEGYFTHEPTDTALQDRLVESGVKTIIEAMAGLKDDPKNIDARANMMWAATLGWNGLFSAGIGGHNVPCHMLGHPVSGFHDVSHGATLSIVTPVWMKAEVDRLADRLAKFFREVFDVQTADDRQAAEEGIERLVQWFQQIGAPVSFAEAGIENPDIVGMSESAHQLAVAWGLSEYSPDRIAALYEQCC